MDAIAVSNLARRPSSEWQGCVLSTSNWDGQASAYRQRNSTQELMRFANRGPMVRILNLCVERYVLSSGNENLDRIDLNCFLQQLKLFFLWHRKAGRSRGQFTAPCAATGCCVNHRMQLGGTLRLRNRYEEEFLINRVSLPTWLSSRGLRRPARRRISSQKHNRDGWHGTCFSPGAA